MRIPGLHRALLFLALALPVAAQETPPPTPPPEGQPPPAGGEPAPAPPPRDPNAPLTPEELAGPPPPLTPDGEPAEPPEGEEPLPGETPPPAAGGGPPPPGTASGGYVGGAAGQEQAAPGSGDLAPTINPLAPSELMLDPEAAMDPDRAPSADAPTPLPTGVPDEGQALRETRAAPAGRSELDRIGGPSEAFGLTTPGAYQRGYRLGTWLVLSPVFRTAVTYDSNIFRGRADANSNILTDDEESGIELTQSVGLTLGGRPSRQTFVSVGYSVLYRTYLGEEGTEGGGNLGRMEASLTARRWSIGANLAVSRLNRPDDPRLGGAQTDRLLLEAVLNGEVLLTRTVGLRAEESIQLVDFQDQDQNDQLNLGVNLLGTWQYARPVRFLAGVGVRDLQYTNSDAVNADVRIYSPIVGVEVRLSTRFSMSLRLGYEVGTITDDRGQDVDDPSGVAVSFFAVWAPNPLWNISLQVTRQAQLALNASSQFNTRIGAEVRRRVFATRVDLFARVGYELQEPEENDDLVSITLGAGADWRVREWLTLGVLLTYLSRDGGDNGDFDVYRAGVSLTFTP